MPNPPLHPRLRRAANVRQPRVSDDSSTPALSREELIKLLEAAEQDSLRSAALITLLAYNGLRIDEALSANVEHYSYQHGHQDGWQQHMGPIHASPATTRCPNSRTIDLGAHNIRNAFHVSAPKFRLKRRRRRLWLANKMLPVISASPGSAL